MRAAAALAVVLLAGCASRPAESDADALAEALAGRTAGTEERCIDLSRADGPQVAGQTLLYRDGRRLWRTDPIDGCPALAHDPIIVVEAFGSQICRGDRFRTVDRGGGIPGPYCRFGGFTPYTKPR